MLLAGLHGPQVGLWSLKATSSEGTTEITGSGRKATASRCSVLRVPEESPLPGLREAGVLPQPAYEESGAAQMPHEAQAAHPGATEKSWWWLVVRISSDPGPPLSDPAEGGWRSSARPSVR